MEVYLVLSSSQIAPALPSVHLKGMRACRTSCYLCALPTAYLKSKLECVLVGLATNEPLVIDQKEPEAAAHAETLVLYVFAGSDPEYVENFRYFLREGVHVRFLSHRSPAS